MAETTTDGREYPKMQICSCGKQDTIGNCDHMINGQPKQQMFIILDPAIRQVVENARKQVRRG